MTITVIANCSTRRTLCSKLFLYLASIGLTGCEGEIGDHQARRAAQPRGTISVGQQAPATPPGGAAPAATSPHVLDIAAGGARAADNTHGPNAVLDGRPTGDAQRSLLCERIAREGRDDVVADGFCGAAAPSIGALKDLQNVLGLGFTENAGPSFVLSGHSASLSVRGTSAINPRALLFTGFNTDDAIVLAYTRGEQAAEIIARDRKAERLNFYFAVYKQPCNADRNCKPADMLTPNTESGWVEFSLYAGEDLENTILDCNTCHLLESEQGKPLVASLRFQELRVPWTHWMAPNTPGGQALLADFRAAHGDEETYAGIPGNRIGQSFPPALQAFVTASGFGTQPNEFVGLTIENEVASSSSGQPQNNDAPGTSQTWQALYENFLAGKAIPIPYHDVKISDAAKLKQMTAAYKAYQAGERASELPDIRQVFRDDRIHEIAGIGIDPKLQGQALITAACTQCHNSRLDQTLTRARFNADLNQLSDLTGGILTGADRDSELERAVQRVRLPASDLEQMPPARLRTLSRVQVDELVAYLCSQMTRPANACGAVSAVTN